MSANGNSRNADNPQNSGQDANFANGSHEIDVGLTNNAAHAEVSDHAGSVSGFKNDSGAEQSCEHTQSNTENKRNGKAFNLRRTNPVQNNADEQSSDVGVKNSGERLLESVADSHVNRCAFVSFFTHTFVNKNVGVDRHT